MILPLLHKFLADRESEGSSHAAQASIGEPESADDADTNFPFCVGVKK